VTSDRFGDRKAAQQCKSRDDGPRAINISSKCRRILDLLRDDRFDAGATSDQGLVAVGLPGKSYTVSAACYFCRLRHRIFFTGDPLRSGRFWPTRVIPRCQYHR
jgi:hypothetical protein